MSWSHRALLIGLQGRELEEVKRELAFAGHEPRVCSSVRDARAALEGGDCCYILSDSRLHARSGGQDLFDEVRASHLPYFVVDAPVGGGDKCLLDLVRRRLDELGCADHNDCGQRPTAGEAPAEGGPLIVLDGAREKKRTGLLVNGKRKFFQNAHYVLFLRLALDRRAGRAAWWGRSELRLVSESNVFYVARRELEEITPDGCELLEIEGGLCRWNLGVRVELDCRALSTHPNKVIAALGREGLERFSR